MFEPLHLATSDKIYPSKEGFYAVIISSIINELRKLNLLNIGCYNIFDSYCPTFPMSLIYIDV